MGCSPWQLRVRREWRHRSSGPATSFLGVTLRSPRLRVESPYSPPIGSDLRHHSLVVSTATVAYGARCLREHTRPPSATPEVRAALQELLLRRSRWMMVLTAGAVAVFIAVTHAIGSARPWTDLMNVGVGAMLTAGLLLTRLPGVQQHIVALCVVLSVSFVAMRAVAGIWQGDVVATAIFMVAMGLVVGGGIAVGSVAAAHPRRRARRCGGGELRSRRRRPRYRVRPRRGERGARSRDLASSSRRRTGATMCGCWPNVSGAVGPRPPWRA